MCQAVRVVISFSIFTENCQLTKILLICPLGATFWECTLQVLPGVEIPPKLWCVAISNEVTDNFS